MPSQHDLPPGVSIVPDEMVQTSVGLEELAERYQKEQAEAFWREYRKDVHEGMKVRTKLRKAKRKQAKSARRNNR